MITSTLPDLTFPTVSFGEKETPWDLLPLLYRGGAATRADLAALLITEGKLGNPIGDRQELLTRIHEEITTKLIAGGSPHSAYSIIVKLREMYAWADNTNRSLSLSSIQSTYLEWADHLLYRVRVVRKISMATARESAIVVGRILDLVLERRVRIATLTRLPKAQTYRHARSAATDKQNLEETFHFGHALLDICHALPIEVIWGTLPVRIQFRSGFVHEHWATLPPRGRVTLANAKNNWQRYNAKVTEKERQANEAEHSLETRWPLVNLRIQAELLIFIAQTGINLSQAHNIKAGKFVYASYHDGYQVRRYKHRRQGEVEFQIFSEYRSVFEDYLAWRNAIFPDDPESLLFPLIRPGGRSTDKPPKCYAIQTICKLLSLRYITPRALRNTRVNWLLRRSRDEDMTAEMAQHTKETLLNVYEKPNLQVAMGEITRFHNQTDPCISPPGPGWCINPRPEAVKELPPLATAPDCQNAAGCLFCEQHRDIDSEDHIWSLTSYRYLKSLEVARYRPPASRKSALPAHPASITIDRLTAKLKFFESSSPIRAQWVNEAITRTSESDFHPAWDGFIRLLEFGA